MPSDIDNLFARLLLQVNRLLDYPHWLPVERYQISFYDKTLKNLSKVFISCTITDEGCRNSMLNDTTLNDLVSNVLEQKNSRTSGNLLKFPSLTLVGDRLALEAGLIYKAYCEVFGEEEEFDSPDFGRTFQFYDTEFRQCEGEEEVFVGFREEASSLLEKLVCYTKKQLQVMSIVGMAGLGKTTLVRRLYNDSYVVSHFYVRAWITCSQVYDNRELLLGILRSVVEITDDVCRMDDTVLAHHLYRALMGQRYFIVIDDIWSSKAWDDLRRCFPDDKNGSKIMLTTRLKDVALHAQPDGKPLCLRFLTEKESFDLFKRKASIMEGYSGQKYSIGRSITTKCRGLPLAIVVIAGLLKTNSAIDWWAQVDEAVSSYILTDEDQYMDTLALSYNHLPQYLRPCFLSFGAFPEDHDIAVRQLIWLWIAEGFIQQDGTEKSLEDIAQDYLLNLIRRSLVIVGRKGSNGAIKTCRIHDLLRDLCQRKAEEDDFSTDIYRYNKHTYLCPDSSTDPSTKSRLLLNTSVPDIPSNSSSSSLEVFPSCFKDVSIIWDTTKIIRALDISSINLLVFPSEVLQLVHLRYLELRFRSGNPPESISHLCELQTLIMSSRTNIVVPKHMWKMLNLRHLCIKSGENLVDFPNVEEEPSLPENLQTISLVSPTRLCQHILARTRILKKLGLCGPLTTKSGDVKFPDLGHLMHLKTLKLLNTVPLRKAGRLSDAIIFPASLNSLTLSNTFLDWNEAWAFEMIPNLEVLKLKCHAFVGKDWETSPGAFPRLKFLKLDVLDIITWTAYRFHFPVLQRLQVHRCPNLIEIPEDLGNICTLEWIELSGCSDAAANSAKEIQKEQESNGNDWLKILHNPGLTHPMHKSKDRMTAKKEEVMLSMQEYEAMGTYESLWNADRRHKEVE